MAFDLKKVIREVLKNKTRSLTYAILGGGVLMLVVLVLFILNAWGVFGGEKDRTEDIITPLNQEVSLYGGALKVWVTGVEKRPLTVFGAASPDDVQQGLVALQVDLRVQYIGTAWEDSNKPSKLGELLRTTDPPTIQVVGIGRQTGAPGVWTSLVAAASGLTDGGIYDLQDRPIPEDAATLEGSIVIKVPIDAAEMSLVLYDYGRGKQANRSGEPRFVYRIPLDARPAE